MTQSASPLRQLARSAGSLAVLNLTSIALAFAVGVLLARGLGPSAYGVYGLSMTVATLAGMVTEFGLPVLTMREVAAARANGRWDLARGLTIWGDRVVLGISALLLGGLGAFWLIDRAAAANSVFLATMLWAILLIPVVALGKLRGLALLSLGHTVAGQLPVLLLRPGLFALGLLALRFLGPPLSAPVAMIVQVAAAFVAMVTVRIAWQRLRPTEMRTAVPTFDRKGWIAACLPMGMTEGLRLLQGQGAVLLLGILATTHDVGIYRVADAMSQMAGVGQTILATAATPLLARLHAGNDRHGLQGVLGATSIGMLLTTFLLGLPVLVLGPELFGFVFGAKFVPSVPVFLIIWTGMLIFAVAGPAPTYANMTGRQNLTTASFVISVLVNVAVATVAIPRLGAIGAAVGVVSANAVANSWLWWQMYRRDGINTSAISRDALAMLNPARLLATVRQWRGAKGN